MLVVLSRRSRLGRRSPFSGASAGVRRSSVAFSVAVLDMVRNESMLGRDESMLGLVDESMLGRDMSMLGRALCIPRSIDSRLLVGGAGEFGRVL